MNYLKHPFLILLLTIGIITCSDDVIAQGSHIRNINGDYIEFDRRGGKDVRRLVGNVSAEHENTKLFCDSAIFYPEIDLIEAYGNVNVRDSDTLNLFGQKLVYNGITKIAVVTEDVSLVDPQVSLSTDKLTFNTETDVATYNTGATIESKTNTLVSEKGFYYAADKLLVFHQDVELDNPECRVYTDTLHFNTVTEIAYLFGPSVIRSDENVIYCENGWYDTRKDIASFSERAWLVSDENKISGDSLYYNRNQSFGKAFGNVLITDTVNNLTIAGNYGEYYEESGHSFITDSAYAIMVDGKDSLFLHADSLFITFDSIQDGKLFNAYHGVRFYRADFQGAADSLVYDFSDSTIRMYHLPVIWFDNSQVTSDSIELLFKNNKIHRMFLVNTSFIISEDSPTKFNQVKGKDMVGYFKNGELKKMFVESNAETIYYVRDDNEALVGINKAVCSQLRIEFEDSEVTRIIFIDKPVGAIFPEKDISGRDRVLKGFLLRLIERPTSRNEIF